jgi:glucose-1-phosphate thymidylyltransferase
MSWGIIPAAGNGMRIQPLAFSKELLPVGSRVDSAGIERPKAVSEYLIERMIAGGARKLCFVISPWKSDILQYYGGAVASADLAYVVQSQASGLCDAIFCALPLIQPEEPVVIGLPDTVWFPDDALSELPNEKFSLLLFRVEQPQLFDSVVTDDNGMVRDIKVKSVDARSNWIWVHGVHAGEHYVDVGTLGGYREAIRLLGSRTMDTTRFVRSLRRENSGRQRDVTSGR